MENVREALHQDVVTLKYELAPFLGDSPELT